MRFLSACRIMQKMLGFNYLIFPQYFWFELLLSALWAEVPFIKAAFVIKALILVHCYLVIRERKIYIHLSRGVVHGWVVGKSWFLFVLRCKYVTKCSLMVLSFVGSFPGAKWPLHCIVSDLKQIMLLGIYIVYSLKVAFWARRGSIVNNLKMFHSTARAFQPSDHLVQRMRWYILSRSGRKGLEEYLLVHWIPQPALKW